MPDRATHIINGVPSFGNCDGTTVAHDYGAELSEAHACQIDATQSCPQTHDVQHSGLTNPCRLGQLLDVRDRATRRRVCRHSLSITNGLRAIGGSCLRSAALQLVASRASFLIFARYSRLYHRSSVLLGSIATNSSRLCGTMAQSSVQPTDTF